MWGNPLVTRFIGGKPFTNEESWARLLRYVGHWALVGFGYWVIEDRATGSFVGELGFADYKRDITPSLEGIPEIGWALLPKWHGKGYATEAVGAIVEWADAHLDAPRTGCLIHPENAPSIRIAEKFGYREHQQTNYKGSPVIMFLRGCQTPELGERQTPRGSSPA